MNVLIKSATVVDSKSDYHNQTIDILIEKGIIAQIGKDLKNPKNYKDVSLDKYDNCSFFKLVANSARYLP